MLNTTVTDLAFENSQDGFSVKKISFERGGNLTEIEVTEQDRIIVTLGSMTEGSSLGSMDSAAALLGKTDGGSWVLWEKIAAERAQFGHPLNEVDVFYHHASRPYVLRTDPGFDGQHPWRRRAYNLPGVQLAGIDRVAPPATLPRAARGSTGLLGLWVVR